MLLALVSCVVGGCLGLCFFGLLVISAVVTGLLRFAGLVQYWLFVCFGSLWCCGVMFVV